MKKSLFLFALLIVLIPLSTSAFSYPEYLEEIKELEQNFVFRRVSEPNFIEGGNQTINVCKGNSCPIDTNPNHYEEGEERENFIKLYNAHYPIGLDLYSGDNLNFGVVLKNNQREDGTYYTSLCSVEDGWCIDEYKTKESSATSKMRMRLTKYFKGYLLYSKEGAGSLTKVSKEECEANEKSCVVSFLVQDVNPLGNMHIRLGFKNGEYFDIHATHGIKNGIKIIDEYLASKFDRAVSYEGVYTAKNHNINVSYYNDGEKYQIATDPDAINLYTNMSFVHFGSVMQNILEPALYYNEATGELRIPEEGEEANCFAMIYEPSIASTSKKLEASIAFYRITGERRIDDAKKGHTNITELKDTVVFNKDAKYETIVYKEKEPVDIKDQGDILVEYNGDGFNIAGYGNKLKIKVVQAVGEELDTIIKHIKEIDDKVEVLKTYNIDFSKEDTEVDELNNEVKITLEIPAKYRKGYDLYVFRNHNGVYERLNADIKDGCIIVHSKFFSTYTLAAEKQTEPNKDTPSGSSSSSSSNSSSSSSSSTTEEAPSKVTNENVEIIKKPIVNTKAI